MESPDFRNNSVVLLDVAKYHTSEETKEALKKLRIPTIYSGPYSYSTASIEMMFASLKQGNLNPEK